MTPILIVKTANGFVLLDYSGEIPQLDLSEVKVFVELKGGYSSRHDALLSAVEDHFTPAEPEQLKAAA